MMREFSRTQEAPDLSISIVSHAQGDLTAQLLEDLARVCDQIPIEVLLTKNLPEPFPFLAVNYPYPVRVVENIAPKGFGANHNAAFKLAKAKLFCVLNPDIRLTDNPFPVLLDMLAHRSASVIAPAIVTPADHVEDNARHFPTLRGIAIKLLGLGDGRYPYAIGEDVFAADWVGGMFMLFRAEDFLAVGGFDESFFMYYEDVDICTRLWKAKRRVLVCPKAQVIHDARRTSRRNLRYMKWHVASMARYFWKHWCRLPRSSAP